jgi:hypothetical protein
LRIVTLSVQLAVGINMILSEGQVLMDQHKSIANKHCTAGKYYQIILYVVFSNYHTQV